jgi:hypothetical protein
MFHDVSNNFSLISNEVLISLYSYLDSTYINYPVATREIFNFSYKETIDTIIFIIHVLRLWNPL